MTKKLQDTGERMIPELHKGKNIYGAHVGRYQAGLTLLADKVVLDIACGSGYGTKMMSTVAKRVYGVDIDSDTIDYAKENFSSKNIKYKLGDGESIPLEDATVDVVVSYETIEHIPDYKKFLDEVKRVLKPEGILLLSTPNDAEYIEGNHFHLHEFKYTELQKLVAKYFKYRKDYFQTLWMYSSILPHKMQTSEWEENVLTTSTVALKPEQAIYFFMICSNRQINEDIPPQGIIGEHYELKKVQEINQRNHDKHAAYVALKERMSIVLAEKAHIGKELDSIKSSKAWKVSRSLQKTSHNVKRIIRK